MKTETTPTPRTDKACTTETARADGLQHKLSEVYHWICAHDQDGFIDSLGYRENLDRVGDRLKDEREQAEDDLKAVRKKLAAEERKNAGLQADVAMLNQRLIERTHDMLEKFAGIEAELRKRLAEAERDAEGLAQDVTVIGSAADELQNHIKQGASGLYWTEYISTRCQGALAAHEARMKDQHNPPAGAE